MISFDVEHRKLSLHFELLNPYPFLFIIDKPPSTFRLLPVMAVNIKINANAAIKQFWFPTFFALDRRFIALLGITVSCIISFLITFLFTMSIEVPLCRCICFQHIIEYTNNCMFRSVVFRITSVVHSSIMLISCNIHRGFPLFDSSSFTDFLLFWWRTRCADHIGYIVLALL